MISRRRFLATGAAGLGLSASRLWAQPIGERPEIAGDVAVLNPRARTPLSLIVDDSTCLVNLARFGIPQFAEVFPEEYTQDWRSLPHEIPDRFVRRFANWCREHGVKGKYSVVPNPACVGWIDRELPGWTRRELTESLNLIRTELLPDWDIHPEMITHTWVINTKTGRPYPQHTADFMENWGWSAGKSADELADYIAYALRILKNAGLPCEGVTTPGGFGNKALPELARGTLDACRDVFNTSIPHYFRHLYTDDRSVAPRVYYASDLQGPNPKCVVSIIGCTGDWFGGWDGLTPGSADRFLTQEATGGRLPEVIDRGEPAIMVCHWPGIYFNGMETGFDILKEVVHRLNDHYDNLLWMKLSEIARYWAARELTAIERRVESVLFNAPFSSPLFTVDIAAPPDVVPRLTTPTSRLAFEKVDARLKLASHTFHRNPTGLTVCFDLPVGRSTLHLDGRNGDAP